MPLLLSGYLRLETADFEDVCKFILVFTTRYSIIGNLDSSGMEDLLFKLAREVRNMVRSGDKPASSKARAHVKSTLTANCPDKEATKTSSLTAILDSTDAKYVMTRLARHIQDPEKQVTLGETNLEHIYPQNPAPDKWGGPLNQEKMEPLTWSIGNLTVYGKRANRKVANDEFQDKAPRYAKSKVAMTNELAKDYTKWDEGTIADRAAALAKLVALVWDFDNPSRV